MTIDRPLTTNRPLNRLRRLAAAGLGLMTLAALAAGPGAAAAAAQGVPADSVLRDFEPTGDFLLVVGGEEKPKAKIYQSQRAAAILIKYQSVFESPVLISPREGVVQTVGIMSLAMREDGAIDILADAQTTPIGRFRLDGEDVVFTHGGQEVRLQPKPPLVGYHSSAEMKEHSPGYATTAAAYKPDATTLAKLRRQTKEVEVKIFFGSWCPFCTRYVPRLLRVEEGLEGSKVAFRFYGMPHPPFTNDPQAKAYDVKGVPTAVVSVGGKEVGRLGRDDWENPEKAIETILEGV